MEPNKQDRILDRFLNDLRAPLSVIHAYTQVLQRRILQRRVYDEQHLLARLAVIERSAKTIEARLREHEVHDRQ